MKTVAEKKAGRGIDAAIAEGMTNMNAKQYYKAMGLLIPPHIRDEQLVCITFSQAQAARAAIKLAKGA